MKDSGNSTSGIINAFHAAREGRKMTQTADLPNEIEGTWEEIAASAPKFNGHRLRVTIIPDSDPEKRKEPVDDLAKPIGNYVDYVRAKQAQIASEPSPSAEELADGEQEIQELLHRLNENRVREGAAPFF